MLAPVPNLLGRVTRMSGNRFEKAVNNIVLVYQGRNLPSGAAVVVCFCYHNFKAVNIPESSQGCS